MARPLLPLLCGTVVLLLPWAAADTVPAPARCSRPKDVANAHIDVGNNTLLNTRLRYTCNPGYKRKAGTSSLIQCILREGSTEPDWTHTTLQCIRKPSLGSQDAMGTGEGGEFHHRRGRRGCRVTWALPSMVSLCCVFPKGTRLYLRKPPAPSSRPCRTPRGRPRREPPMPARPPSPLQQQHLGCRELPAGHPRHQRLMGRHWRSPRCQRCPHGYSHPHQERGWPQGHLWGQPRCPPPPRTMLQSPSRPWPLPLVSRAKSLFWQAGAYFLYFLA
ncbi:uncharacterized protein LOC142029689 isoform X5 [Buteo buteo]|uniref:uncharacterized protein LOC142029689 isoform X5 n=1 Tax=Buteo buteo TaxID=30397 RepID=UPI003EB83EF7